MSDDRLDAVFNRAAAGQAEIANHEAYAAIQHIKRGDWDRYLISLQIALRTRLTAEEFKTAVLKQAEFTAGKPTE